MTDQERTERTLKQIITEAYRSVAGIAAPEITATMYPRLPQQLEMSLLEWYQNIPDPERASRAKAEVNDLTDEEKDLLEFTAISLLYTNRLQENIAQSGTPNEVDDLLLRALASEITKINITHNQTATEHPAQL